MASAKFRPQPLIRPPQRHSARKRRRRLAVVAVICLLMLAWSGGFYIFVNQVPRSATAGNAPADAIVVLTGGTGRLETGLRLLREKQAPKVFVSGVHRGVDVRSLLRLSQRFPQDLDCCVFLGHEADNTNGNATETAAWIKAEKARSLLLVTAGYHMPRSLLEFRSAMPDIEIHAHPVFPDRVKMERWWLWPGTTGLLMAEYTKCLAAVPRLAFTRLHNLAGTVWR